MDWEPLPPRTAGRRRHRHILQQSAQTETTISDNNDTTTGEQSRNKNYKERKKEPSSQRRRKNRPGFNSYLKVELYNDATMKMLHEMTLQLQKDFEARMIITAEFTDEASTRTEDQKSDKERADKTEQALLGANEQPPAPSANKIPIRIRPRSLNSLHMTFFFGGETLCELPESELSTWHAQVTNRLQTSGFCLQDTNNNDDNKHQQDHSPSQNTDSSSDPIKKDDGLNESDCEDEYWFRVQEIRTFPPRRNNLIVAVLEASPKFHDLHNDIRNIAQQSTYSDGLRNISEYSKEIWTPHITLANLIVSGPRKNSKEPMNILNEMLQEQLDNNDSNTTDKKIIASGIAMGGPIPEQVELDWQFQFQQQQSSTKKSTSQPS